MRVVALVSGGKDSSYSLLQCIAANHEVVALANVQPSNEDELDSFMYQTVGHQGVSLYAEATGLPLYRKETGGIARHCHKWYKPTEGDEVEDLYHLLARVKSEMNVDAVSTGAILSDYQRLRVENVCSRLGLVSLAYLWRRDQGELLQEMIDNKVEAMVIKVAGLGLDPSIHLGMRLKEMQPHLLKMNTKFGLNICGEGGEYETFTLDCPFFKKRIIINDYEIVIHSDAAFAPVGYINFKQLSLIDKPEIISFDSFKLSNENFLKYLDDADCLNNLSITDEGKDEKISCNPETDQSVLETVTDSERSDVLFFQMISPKLCSSNSGWFWLGSLIGHGLDSCIALSSALKLLNDSLSSKNYSVKDLVSVTLFIRDMSQFSNLNEIYTKIVGSDHPPVRVCLETKLPENSPILIDAVAHKNPVVTSTNIERCFMHVQSISHWAPANIGPYSQSAMVGDITYVAGQIALVPGTMQVVQGEVVNECRLALRHVERIINATDPNITLRDVVQAICFVTREEFIGPARREWEKRSSDAIVDYLVVPSLPRNVRIEWQVWAHRGNPCFLYEETGHQIGSGLKALSCRRFNYENTASAVVCYLTKDEHASSHKVECIEVTRQTCVKDFIDYTLSILSNDITLAGVSPCSLKIFYPTSQHLLSNDVHQVLENLTSNSPIAYTLIPVLQLLNANTMLSICAVRFS